MPGNLVGTPSGEFRPAEAHRAAAWRNEPHDGFEQRGPARSVASYEAHDLAGRDRKVGAAQDMALAVMSVQIAYLQRGQAGTVPR